MKKKHTAYCIRENGESVIVKNYFAWDDEPYPTHLYLRDLNEKVRVIAVLTEYNEAILRDLLTFGCPRVVVV